MEKEILSLKAKEREQHYLARLGELARKGEHFKTRWICMKVGVHLNQNQIRLQTLNIRGQSGTLYPETGKKAVDVEEHFGSGQSQMQLVFISSGTKETV